MDNDDSIVDEVAPLNSPNDEEAGAAEEDNDEEEKDTTGTFISS